MHEGLRVHDDKFIERKRQTESCEKVHDHQRSWQLTRFIKPSSRNKGIRSMKMIWNMSSALRIERNKRIHDIQNEAKLMWFHYGSHGSKVFPDIIVLEHFHRPNVFDSCLFYGKGKKTLPSLWKEAIIDSRPHHVYSHKNYNWIPYLMLLNISRSAHNFLCHFYKTYISNKSEFNNN